MSDAIATQARLAELETDRATGCLTIESSGGQVGHVYFLFGRPFHAESPSKEGPEALAEATSWPDVELSFDSRARLPTKQTIATAPLPDSAQSPRGDRIGTDARVFVMSCVSLGGGALTVLAPLIFLAIGLATHSEWAYQTAVVTLFLFAAVWIAGVIGFRIVFLREAVKVPGGLPRSEIPMLVEASSGVISGEPELAVNAVARCLTGRIGRCRLEFYSSGLQISRGPDRPEPRWQFAYSDLAQAELLDVASSGKTTVHQYYVRLVATRPRMAFLFKNTWRERNATSLIFAKLGEHRVKSYSEELDC